MRSALLIGAGASVIAAALFYRNRDSGASADALDEVVSTARRVGDSTLETLEEVSTVARNIAATTTNSTSGSRGYRNNNPGNIRRSADKWQGLSPTQSDAAFFQFIAPQWGVRAMAKILLTYRSKYGLETVRDIINRWAPPIENNTSAYVSSVSAALSVKPDERIDVSLRLVELVRAIIRHENSGPVPYSSAQLTTWVSLP